MIEPALARIRNIHPNLPLYSWRVKECLACHERMSAKTSRMGFELCPKCRKDRLCRDTGGPACSPLHGIKVVHLCEARVTAP